MKKCDILALIKACQNKIEEILDMNISEKNKKGFEELLHATEKHYNIVENAKEDDTKLFESYASLYSSLYYKLRTIDGKVYSENVGLALYTQLKKAESKEVTEPKKGVNNSEPTNVIDVDYEEVDEKKKKKTLGIIAGASCTIAALAIIFSLAKENSKLKNQINGLTEDEPKEAQETVIEEKPSADIEEEITIEEPSDTIEEPSDTIEAEPIEEETKLDLANIDINDEDALYTYAEKLANTPGNTLTVEEIITALKLANFDSLENKSVFASREELYKANTDLGYVQGSKLNGNSVIQIQVQGCKEGATFVVSGIDSYDSIRNTNYTDFKNADAVQQQTFVPSYITNSRLVIKEEKKYEEEKSYEYTLEQPDNDTVKTFFDITVVSGAVCLGAIGIYTVCHFIKRRKNND